MSCKNNTLTRLNLRSTVFYKIMSKDWYFTRINILTKINFIHNLYFYNKKQWNNGFNIRKASPKGWFNEAFKLNL